MHLRFGLIFKISGFVTQDDEKLREISRELEGKLGVLVPLSFNSLKAGQRFLNTRTYGVGKKESYETVDEVCKAIEREGTPHNSLAPPSALSFSFL